MQKSSVLITNRVNQGGYDNFTLIDGRKTDLVVGTNKANSFSIEHAGTPWKCVVHLKEAADADITFNIKIAGVNLTSSPITVAAATVGRTVITTFAITTFNVGDEVQYDLLTCGSTVKGQDLTVQMYWLLNTDSLAILP